MTRNFSVTGGAALLALAACWENGEGVSFAFDSPFHGYVFDPNYALAPADTATEHLSVEVERTFSRPGTYRYRCTIHQDTNGTLVE
jgi:hypothetical protein